MEREACIVASTPGQADEESGGAGATGVGSAAHAAALAALQEVEAKVPKKIKKRRMVTGEDGVRCWRACVLFRSAFVLTLSCYRSGVCLPAEKISAFPRRRLLGGRSIMITFFRMTILARAT